MTTTIDPLGTPSVVYNRDGVAIIEVEADNPAGIIPQVSGYTVVLSSNSNPTSSNKLQLPANADVGDVVEIHLVSPLFDTSIDILPPSGENMNFGGLNLNTSGGKLYRKVRSDLWAAVGPN